MITPISTDDESSTFLKSGIWLIDNRSRKKTRAACLAVLRRLPEDVRAFLIKSRRVMVLAPPVGSPGCIYPFTIVTVPTEETLRYQIVTLPEVLENAPFEQVVLILVKCIAAALREAGDRSIKDPEERAVEWGFAAELKTIKALEQGRKRVAGWIS